jgi:hypothetical protein
MKVDDIIPFPDNTVEHRLTKAISTYYPEQNINVVGNMFTRCDFQVGCYRHPNTEQSPRPVWIVEVPPLPTLR